MVGSFPRPTWLLDAISRCERGKLRQEELKEYFDDAVLLTLKEQEVSGVDIVSDGEQRRFSFLAFVSERLPSFRLVPVAELMNVQARKFADEMHLPIQVISNPVIVGEVRRSAALAVDELAFARQHSEKLIKVPLVGPYTLLVNSWNRRLSGDIYGEPEDAVPDLARLIREEILALRDAGAFFVQLDEPGIGNFVDYRYTRFLLALNEWKVRDLKPLHALAVEIINRAVQGVSGVKLGIHVCRGNWPAKEQYLSWGGYESMIAEILDLKVDQLVLEFATKRAGNVEVFRDHPTKHELGLGVIDVKSRRIEKPEEIVERVDRALRYFDPTKLYLNPDCGFASGRPWPVVPRQVAFAKLRSQAKAARILRRRYGA